MRQLGNPPVSSPGIRTVAGMGWAATVPVRVVRTAVLRAHPAREQCRAAKHKHQGQPGRIWLA